MIEVGVRQLKNGLTHYLRLAQNGQCVLVTNRRQPVALLKRPDMDSAQTTEERLAAMAAAGKLIPAKERGPMKPFKPRKLRGKPFSQSIIEDRR
jgi:antitoxin (DNA-binding transcriptional repressor) of toxin-antitoxin stability system